MNAGPGELLLLAKMIEAGRVPCLSIKQPWPHHIFHDGKDVENRGWPTRRRGWILIHAAKTPDDAELTRRFDAPLGGIVGAARIVDCVTRSESKWFCGPCGFVLRDATPIEIVPCRGALGFFDPPAGTAPIVVERLRAIAAGGGL